MNWDETPWVDFWVNDHLVGRWGIRISYVRIRRLRSADTRIYAFRQSDAHQLRRQSLQCSWTSSLELSADGPQTAGIGIYSRFRQSMKTYFIRSVEPKRSVNLRFNCALEILLLTYLFVLIVVTQVYRDGKQMSPHCIIINSRTEPSLFITPGPAAYSPGRPDVSSRHSRPPAFSISRADSAASRRSILSVTPGELMPVNHSIDSSSSSYRAGDFLKTL